MDRRPLRTAAGTKLNEAPHGLGMVSAAGIDRTGASSPLVSLRSVSKIFSNGTVALKDMSLDVRQGEFVAVIGRNAVGPAPVIGAITGAGVASEKNHVNARQSTRLPSAQHQRYGCRQGY